MTITTDHDDPAYIATVETLFSLRKPRRDPTHQRMRRLLALLDHPERSFPFGIITIGGSSGKGTTATLLATLLGPRGLGRARRVGLLRSPHLHSFCERIVIDTDPIAPGALVEWYGVITPALEQLRALPPAGQFAPCFTEAVLALALCYFRAHGVDLAVIESGLGGAHDPASILPSRATLLTTVSLDHTHLLGDTVAAIAAEKAGLIRSESTVVTGKLAPDANAVVHDVCALHGARLFQLGAAFEIKIMMMEGAPFEQVLLYRGLERRGPGSRIERTVRFPRAGAQLAQSVGCALAMAEALGAVIPRDGSSTALERAFDAALALLPARMELLFVADRGGGRPTILVDGAHNTASLTALRTAVRTVIDLGGFGRLIVLLAVATNKPVKRMTAAVVPGAAIVIATRARYRGSDPDAIAQAARRCRTGRVVVEPEIARAVETALAAAGPDDLLLVTGSMYMIEDARALLINHYT